MLEEIKENRVIKIGGGVGFKTIKDKWDNCRGSYNYFCRGEGRGWLLFIWEDFSFLDECFWVGYNEMISVRELNEKVFNCLL